MSLDDAIGLDNDTLIQSHNDLVHWRDQCLDVKFTRWMNRSFQGPERIRYNEICEEARNLPRMLATEAVRKKSFLHKNMPWLSTSAIAAIAGAAAVHRESHPVA